MNNLNTSMGSSTPMSSSEMLSSGIDNDNGNWEDDGWDETLANINEADIVPELAGFNYKFQNVSVQFPYPAYKSQVDMMEKIMEGVTTSENCLLESPTGTGKTAALLCALLAWQKDCYDRQDNCGEIIDAKLEKIGGCTCGLIQDKDETTVLIKVREGKVYLHATTYAPADTSESVLFTPTKESPIGKSPMATTPNRTPSTSTSRSTTPKRPEPMPSPSCFESPIKKLKLLEGFNREPSEEEVLTEVIEATAYYNSAQYTSSFTQTQKKKVLSTEQRSMYNVCGYCVRKYVRDTSRPPRIYYCTRTHSQIAQVVKQLKNTAYKSVPMTILSSRELTCISNIKEQEDIRYQQMTTQERNENPKSTLNDLCITSIKKYFKIKGLEERHSTHEQDCQCEKVIEELKKEVCKFYRMKKEFGTIFSPFQREGAWDLDDIKRVGYSCESCPYFGCYALHENADIIFCPYNYLIDPSLREQTGIKYSNSVVVFDEAHNIEDICRSAFSFTIDVANFDEIRERYIDYLLVKGNEPRSKVGRATLQKLSKVSAKFQQLSCWIKERGQQLKSPKDNELLEVREEFESDKLFDALNEMGLVYENIEECMTLIGQGDKKDGEGDEGYDFHEEEVYYNDRDEPRPFKVPSTVGEMLKRLKQPVLYLSLDVVEGIGGTNDFKGFLTRTPNPKFGNRNRITEGQSMEKFLYKFELICLNPALAFRVLRNSTYSVIVASGTLTPLDSFAGELATNFDVQLQADHVIPRANVLASVVGIGPRNTILELTRKFQDNLEIQDEIGEIIYEICNIVPNGILVFLPSYSLMEKLERRWRDYPLGNSVFKRIESKKLIFKEESRDKRIFKQDMERYKEEVKGSPTRNGCILFAVFRGKISEGIDFADEQARAVVTIGIPYSNAVAPAIIAKKKYNNAKKPSRNGEKVLNGSEWYTTQAFRAMNQGFGRCVRHNKDWGSLIMIDTRMGQGRNQSYISGWIRNSLTKPRNFNEFKFSLEQFIAKMKRLERAEIKRSQIRIQYESPRVVTRNSLDDTEEMNISVENVSFEIGDDEATQEMPFGRVTGDVDIHNLPTQSLDNFTEDQGTVSDSSSNYDFEEEIEEVMNPQQTSTPLETDSYHPVGLVGRNDSDTIQNRPINDGSDSPSYFERSPSSSPVRSVARRSSQRPTQAVNETESEQLSELSRSQNSQSDIMVVSVDSIADEDIHFDTSQVSQGSSISYHSDDDDENS